MVGTILALPLITPPILVKVLQRFYHFVNLSAKNSVAFSTNFQLILASFSSKINHFSSKIRPF
jgi:hypothetical protein